MQKDQEAPPGVPGTSSEGRLSSFSPESSDAARRSPQSPMWQVKKVEMRERMKAPDVAVCSQTLAHQSHPQDLCQGRGQRNCAAADAETRGSAWDMVQMDQHSL